MIHVMGTVTGITTTSVKVETTDKTTVEVLLTDTTAFLNGSTPSTKKELKVGDRVVIHAVKGKDDALQAHEVRFSQGTPPPAH
jgi:co-chaperonin GroES (HSP10)